MSIFAKAKKARENKKGFTLVELIVVLVILAILAAMMVPALLGWIDEARNKQYVLEARSVYMAAQALADEAYAKAGKKLAPTDLSDTDVKKLSDVNVEPGWLRKGTVAGSTDYSKEAFTIKSLSIKFKSANGKDVYAELTNDTWTVSFDNGTAPAVFTTPDGEVDFATESS